MDLKSTHTPSVIISRYQEGKNQVHSQALISVVMVYKVIKLDSSFLRLTGIAPIGKYVKHGNS